MKIFSIFALIAAVSADKILDESIYKPDSLLYQAKKNIVGIHAPVYLTKSQNDIFIVEENNGLYAIDEVKDEITERNIVKATKILENGKCITSDKDGVYFGASDGIYTYNFNEKTAEKYGYITADIKAIQKDINKDLIYAIVDNNLNKITEHGTKMTKVESVGNVQDIVLDKSMNLYMYEKVHSEKVLGLIQRDTYKPKVLVEDKVIDVNMQVSNIKLVRMVATEDGAFLIIDKRIHRVFANGTSVSTDFVFDDVPTACFIDLGVVQLYSKGMRLYQFNVIGLILQGLKSNVVDFLSSISGSISRF